MPEGYLGHPGLVTYEPAFKAQADSAVFPFEVLALGDVSGMGDITVRLSVEHKNSDDTAFTTNASQDLASVGITEINATGLKEFVRIKYSFINNGGTFYPQDWAYIRMLEPTWYQNQ